MTKADTRGVDTRFREDTDTGPPRQRATIASVSGRRTAGGSRGLPVVHDLALKQQDGTVLEFETPRLGVESRLDVVTPILAQSFPMCPVCLSGSPSEKEHIPQYALGGRVMTMTCSACNNGLGSRVEAELQDWFDHALVSVSFEHEDLPGRRRAPRLLYRNGPSGFCLLIEGDLAPEIQQMLDEGTFHLHYRRPDPRRYRLAALKHAYLAACLYLGYVPAIPDAEAIRADLLSARDSPKRSRPPASEHADRLAIYQSHAPPKGPPLAIVATRLDEPAARREYLISLAGVMFVSWPFTEVPPRKGIQRIGNSPRT